MAEKVIATIPPAPLDRPIEGWSLAELLNDTARHGLLRVREFVTKRPITAGSDFREDRQLAEAGANIAKLFAHIQEAQLRANADTTDWAAYMRDLKREERALGLLDQDAPKAKRARKDSSRARK
jgi:hypothetical protein